MKNMDSLLKTTLSCNESPDEFLNIKLKSTLRRNADKPKTISLWWIPMTASIIISLILVILINMLIFNYKISTLINIIIIINMIFNVIITLIGLKFFDLKKGAEINI